MAVNALKFKSLSELETKPEGAEAWLIDQLVPIDSCCLIVGAPKTRKSWFLYEIIVAAATGTKAFDLYQAKQAKVMLIQGEDSEAIIKDRLNGLASIRSSNSGHFDNIRILAGQTFHLDNVKKAFKKIAFPKINNFTLCDSALDSMVN